MDEQSQDDRRTTDTGDGRGTSKRGEYEYLYEKYDLP
jgi:hypothetical protein